MSAHRPVTGRFAASVLRHRDVLVHDLHWEAARYAGVCDRCGKPFPAGAAVCNEPGTGWRAECCAG